MVGIARSNIKIGLMNDIPDGTDFYFVHSYVFCEDKSEGWLYPIINTIPAVVGKDNI